MRQTPAQQRITDAVKAAQKAKAAGDQDGYRAAYQEWGQAIDAATDEELATWPDRALR